MWHLCQSIKESRVFQNGVICFFPNWEINEWGADIPSIATKPTTDDTNTVVLAWCRQQRQISQLLEDSFLEDDSLHTKHRQPLTLPNEEHRYIGVLRRNCALFFVVHANICGDFVITMVVGMIEEYLQSIFEEKYVNDDREPLFNFTIPGYYDVEDGDGRSIVFGLFAPSGGLWKQVVTVRRVCPRHIPDWTRLSFFF